MNKNILSKLKEKYPELDKVNERTLKAINLYKKIAKQAKKDNWQIIFLSGLAADANFGYLTRQHRDADLIASHETAEKIKIFLEKEGHIVYVPEKVKNECLKVDQAEPGSPMRCHCDIHYFWEDENGKVVIPSMNKELKFSGGFKEISKELEFLGENALFLKPKYVIEEKIGWRDQIGLTFREEYQNEIEKLEYLIGVLGSVA